MYVDYLPLNHGARQSARRYKSTLQKHPLLT